MNRFALYLILASLSLSCFSPSINVQAKSRQSKKSESTEAQNIKSGSPLAMLITNLKNSSYIDKKVYTEDKCLRLTAKGEKQAIDAIKKAIKI